MSFAAWLKSRPFSIFYLSSIWALVAMLDFGSTRNCTGTWQLAFICDQAIWIDTMISDPMSFFLSLFTAPWFHNGIDHILLVTIAGFLIIVPSFEVHYGPVATAILFFFLVVITTTFIGGCFNLANIWWPENEFVSFVYGRNWMGGSAGFYGIYGALLQKSKKPLTGLLIVACWETFSNQVFGISSQINLMHMTAATFGFLTWGYWLRRQKNADTTQAV